MAIYDLVWPGWNQTGNYTTSNLITSDNTAIWGQWTSGTTSTITNQIWGDWNGYYQIVTQPYVAPVQTAEQLEAARVEQERLHAAWVAEQAKQAEAAREAKRKARVLLLDHLTPEQAAEFETVDQFHVKVGDKTYRIKRGWSHNVELIEEKTGRKLESHCIHPRDHVPEEDNMLAQKLMLEADEAAFRRLSVIQRFAA